MAITTIDAAGARSIIARPNCSITPAVRRSLIGGVLVASPLVSGGIHLPASGGLCRFPASNSPLFFSPCASLRLEDVHRIVADLLRAPASHPANQLASPY
jgi:hypothetical protein